MLRLIRGYLLCVSSSERPPARPESRPQWKSKYEGTVPIRGAPSTAHAGTSRISWLERLHVIAMGFSRFSRWRRPATERPGSNRSTPDELELRLHRPAVGISRLRRRRPPAILRPLNNFGCGLRCVPRRGNEARGTASRPCSPTLSGRSGAAAPPGTTPTPNSGGATSRTEGWTTHLGLYQGSVHQRPFLQDQSALVQLGLQPLE